MEQIQKIYNGAKTAACYFRSTAKLPNRKIILQLTEKCNLHCKHCFVSSTESGQTIPFDDVQKILSALRNSGIKKITVTGGEPLLHPQIKEIISLFSENDIETAICTNAVLAKDEFVSKFCRDKKVHFNVSLDGFRAESHGRFRGNDNPQLFNNILQNIRSIGENGLLNGILVTPNKYADVIEYREICSFAKQNGAKYVLFNPLSEFGRGQDSTTIGYHGDKLTEIRELTKEFIDQNFEVIYIRFPDCGNPISKCPLGAIPYIFTNGDVAICPYLVFAATDRVSRYSPTQFIVGNIFDQTLNINEAIDKYTLPLSSLGLTRRCNNLECPTGCYAAKISRGLFLEDCDIDLCNRYIEG